MTGLRQALGDVESESLSEHSLAEPLLLQSERGDETIVSSGSEDELMKRKTSPDPLSLLVLLWMGSIVGIFLALIGIFMIDAESNASTAESLVESPPQNIEFSLVLFAFSLIWSFATALISYFVYIIVGVYFINMIRKYHSHRIPSKENDEISWLPEKEEDESNTIVDQYMFSLGTMVGFTTICLAKDFI